MPVKIFYFSGTGNSLWTALRLQELLEGPAEVLNIGALVGEKRPVLEAEAIIVVYPSYGYGAPHAVRQVLSRCVLRTGYFAALVTYGTKPGGALADIARILRRKKTASPLAQYYGRIPSVENYIPIFGPPKDGVVEDRIPLQEAATAAAAQAIARRDTTKVFRYHPGFVVSRIFSLGRIVFRPFFHVAADCNGCGLCTRICPVGAITMVDGRPKHGIKCEHCQGCFNWCPQRALSFGRMKAHTPRYRHPAITPGDFQ
jgi:ferredoxin